MWRDEQEKNIDEDAAQLASVFGTIARGGGGQKRSAAERTGPAFYVVADSDIEVGLSAVGADGHGESSMRCTPAQELLRAVEIDYTRFRDEVMRLWTEYPLDGTDRAVKKKELARLSEEVCETAELLREIDPLGYFYVGQRLDENRPLLDAALMSEDVELMDAGARLLNILEEPAHAQVRLRNMFEVAFDGTERASQRVRFERLTATYPSAVDRHYPMRRLASEGDIPLSTTRVEYLVTGLDELYQLLLMLHFSQGDQRIVRCECCFGYFIPKSSRPTIYCDRVFDGKSCKAAGAGWKHLAALDRDAALRIYDTLRHKRATDFGDYMGLYKGRTDPEYVSAQEEWNARASAAREAYLAREIDAAEFLRRVGYDGEPVESASTESSRSEWQQRVERDINFDPWLEYSDMLTLDLGVKNPQWEITPAAEQVREAQGEHRSLRDWYGKR